MSSPWRIERLGSHDRSTFASGVEPLDRYMREQASQDVKRKVAVCYVATDLVTGNLAGYFTLAATSIALVDVPADLQRKLPRYPSIPAARIGRLAVDKAFRGQGLGGLLIADALKRVLASDMGVFATVVDAKDDRAARFYEHHGFVRLGSQPRVLFMAAVKA
jgi:GNAT superfamily N-acetyltransferase